MRSSKCNLYILHFQLLITRQRSATPNKEFVVYIQTSQAANLLASRHNLRTAVEDWWKEQGWGIPPLPEHRDMAILARHIGTFRYEDALFFEMTHEAGLHPVWMEYRGDKMFTGSNSKRSLCHPKLSEGRRNKNNELIVVTQKLTNPSQWEGKQLDTILFESGQPMIGWHNAHQDKMLAGEQYSRFDITPWYRTIGQVREYYIGLLSLFVSHGVLFEDYHGGESGGGLDSFTQEVFTPAWELVRNKFGVEPLIVKLPWWPELGYYPSTINWREHGVIPPEFKGG